MHIAFPQGSTWDNLRGYDLLGPMFAANSANAIWHILIFINSFNLEMV
jgi:hypothetical protein